MRKIVLFIYMFVACSSSPEDPEDAEFRMTGENENPCASNGGDEDSVLENIGAALTGDPQFGAIAVHRNGEQIAAMTTTIAVSGIANVTGAVWATPDGGNAVVYLGPTGLPDQAVVDDYVFLFENYSESGTVDVAVVFPDGSTEIIREVELDSDAVDALDILSSGDSCFGGTRTWGLARSLRVVAAGTTVVGCVVGGIVSSGILPALLAVPCATALVRTIVFVAVNDDDFQEIADVADAICCGLDDPRSCIKLAAGSVAARAADVRAQHTQAIADAERTLAEDVGVEGEAEAEGEGECPVMLNGCVWMREPESEIMNQEDARDWCAGLNRCGRDDWRLPTKSEMETVCACSECGLICGYSKIGWTMTSESGEENCGPRSGPGPCVIGFHENCRRSDGGILSEYSVRCVACD